MTRLPALLLAALFATSTLLLAGCEGGVEASADDVVEGETFPERTLNDQHGNPLQIPGAARVILKTVEMAPADIANAVLGEMTEEQRNEIGVIYIADIHQMPPHVMENVVLPRMQAREYPTAITRSEEDAGFMPHTPEEVTVILLDGEGTVTGIHTAANEDRLKELLEKAGE
ncbi:MULTISPECIES: hypothetical protein [unclassified Thioalkalivibrio]|uniref:hypothetical protein n=1 Tax=unclassified Thioalkalivibrio TaxID=2621013 RepID=UPI000367FF7F|nr:MULTISPECIES: hypothetical protein [unclassified Thioalkalivibrio]